jgi:hypothetical protein
MTNKALEIVWKIGYWYLLKHGTYIRVYGATKSPHLLQRFVPDRLVLHDIAYQTVIHGVGQHSTKIRRPYGPLYHYGSDHTPFEASIKLKWRYTCCYESTWEEIFRRHDTKEVVKEYCSKHKHSWEDTSTTWEEEEVHCSS